MITTIIVACDPNRVIGTATNTIPWNLPEDMKFFKETTRGHPVIMGRNTWNSLHIKPLPKRLNIVVTRTMTASSDNDTFTETKPIIVNSLEDALDTLKLFKSMTDPFIIGGAQIYKTALENNLVDKILMTRVHNTYQGTVYFPNQEEYGFTQNRVVIKNKDFDIIEYIK
jgi:dihydrofolate reductase